MVTRRLFRSGESEYQLNGKFCRLRDIQDIFMGTGLGPESYALIEQGRIGQILSSKPTDRRNIIEEAAGITKFKARKRLAEARLADAKQNLARINDIFDEVTRQMNSLKRQAAKAERFARLRDEMRGKLRLVLASRFTELQQHAAESELANALGEELRTRTQAVQQMESEHAERAQRASAIDNEAQQARERLNQLNLEMDRGAARSRNNDERCAEFDARSAAAEAEIAQTTEQLERLQEELAGNQQVLESAAADVALPRPNCGSGSRRRRMPRRLCNRWSGNRNSIGAPSWRRSPPPRVCATASSRPRSALPPWNARRTAGERTGDRQSAGGNLRRAARPDQPGIRVGAAEGHQCGRADRRDAQPA